MKKIFVIALTAVLSVMSANAQEQCCKNGGEGCCFEPYWYAQFQGGVNLPIAKGNIGSFLSPAFSFNIGRVVNPYFAARIGVEGCHSKVNIGGEYEEFKYATASFDGMLNLVNVFSEKKCHPLNFYVIGGVGASWSEAPTNNSSKFSPNLRTGVAFDWRVCKSVSLSLEYRIENTNDQFDGVVDNSHDWYSNLYFGIAYNLPSAQKKVIDRTAEINALNEKINALRAENEALKNKPAQVVTKEVVKTVVEKEAVLPSVFFQLNKSKIQKNQVGNVITIAKYLQANPDMKLTITGYASPEGKVAANQKLSENRANAVKNALVKKYGISEDRINIVVGGPTNDVYTERDLNRVAVSVAK